MTTTPFKDLAKTGGNPEFFRARGTYFYSGAGYIFCAGMIASILVESDSLNFSQRASIAFILFVVALIYRFLNRPTILFTDRGLGIRNPFSTIIVDWSDVTTLNTKYALTVETKHGVFTCWSAVGPSRYQHRAIHRGDLGKIAERANSIRATDSPHADSGAALYIATDRLSRRKEAGGTHVVHVMQKHMVARALHALSLLAFVVSIFHN
jgi:hypothetical protein